MSILILVETIKESQGLIDPDFLKLELPHTGFAKLPFVSELIFVAYYALGLGLTRPTGKTGGDSSTTVRKSALSDSGNQNNMR